MDLGSDASVLISALFLLLHLNKQGNYMYLCKRNPFCILLMCISRKLSRGGGGGGGGGLASDKRWSQTFYHCNNQYFGKLRVGTGPHIPLSIRRCYYSGKVIVVFHNGGDKKAQLGEWR